MDREEVHECASYPREERLARSSALVALLFLYGAWAALAVEPHTEAVRSAALLDRAALHRIEQQVGRILGPTACSDRGNPAIDHARGARS